jgi:hypothetical protein
MASSVTSSTHLVTIWNVAKPIVHVFADRLDAQVTKVAFPLPVLCPIADNSVRLEQFR